MFKVSVKVEGLREMISGLDNVTRQDWQQAKTNSLIQAAKIFETEADSKVHVITGKTQNSIRVDPVDVQNNTVDIVAAYGAPYE